MTGPRYKVTDGVTVCEFDSRSAGALAEVAGEGRMRP